MESRAIHIRNAREDDGERLAEIGLRAWHEAMAAIGQEDALIEAARRAFERFVAEGWLSITVIEWDGMIAGWAAREGFTETISDFWIDPAFTRRGLGSALLARVEADMRVHGFDRVEVQTHAGNNQAIAFFRAHGYGLHWLTVVYNPKLDRDIPTVGLSKSLEEEDETGSYGVA